ncbi:hypothetical protein KMW28_26805 [Flammeovirga yaeyamensis]|uniref:Uncharacterized protein n=1 Tax=Flammeovirga yaeyamensis TaxID=367791 RepID=A0AAX1NAM6_9BACT|nr:hypothetical protein [Flammeovirga yaeyamensis]MBB3701406.1 hypothetical protein [Flammeovirga yaeyamensis]NMF38636.1 hypothetical protein [Flammeovirga yaeyamensis]QWG04510.1 hypothetical protein KMW28_26805 [Flammeovirga yaeyamensis]
MSAKEDLIPFDIVNEGNPYVLLNEAKEFLASLQNEKWTDFGTHDPGMTLLEYLSTGMTEMSIRAASGIENYLTYAPYKSAILAQEEAFSVLPVTTNDLRKVLIDRFVEIENIWVEPVSTDVTSFEGQYQLIAKFKPQYQGRIDQNVLLEHILEHAQQYRNYCEKVMSITTAKETKVVVQADIEIVTDVTVEEVYAKTLYSLNRFFSPQVKMSSYEELIEQNTTTSKIFEGPLLERGFIPEEQLHHRQFSILTSAVIRTLMEIDEVVGVKNLSLQANGTTENSLLKLDNSIPIFNEDDVSSIHFLKNGIISTQIDFDKVYALLDQLKASNEGSVKNNNKRKRNNSITKHQPIPNKYLNSLNIKEMFPTVYGVGKFGLPGDASKERKRSAGQFKTFINFFENQSDEFFAQLFDLPKLFSAKGLVSNNDLLETEQGFLRSAHFNNDKKKNQILDYLIGVHGERFDNELISSFTPYLSQEEITQRLIFFKAYFLRYLPLLLSAKSSVQPINASLGEWAITPLHLRLMLFTGVGKNVDLSVTLEQSPILFNSSKTLSDFDLWLAEKDVQVYQSLEQYSFDCIDTYITVASDQAEQIIKDHLTLDMMHQCIYPKNMYVVEVKSAVDNAYEIVYFSKEKNSYFKLGSYPNWDEAEQTAVALHRRILTLHDEYEGFQIVEHLDLQPSTEEHCFGIYILNEEQEHVLMSDVSLDFEKREQLIKLLPEYFMEGHRYDVERLNDGNFRMLFKIPEFGMNCIGMYDDESVQKIHKDKERLFDYLSDKFDRVAFDKKVNRHITLDYATTNQTEDVERIVEQFFNFSISMVFPCISHRFRNSEFQVMVQNLCREETAAHIQVNTKWLTPEQFYTFESYMYQLRSQEISTEEQVVLRDNMLSLLH